MLALGAQNGQEIGKLERFLRPVEIIPTVLLARVNRWPFAWAENVSPNVEKFTPTP
jgi:hypothetical protein